MQPRAMSGVGVLAAMAGILAFAGTTNRAIADDGPPCPRGCKIQHAHRNEQSMPAAGTLGYGPPGIQPGFQGFGLGWHRGHGYGGQALGTGAEGGYPFYGGPGYPHPAPRLRRIGGINPFPHWIGPGGPTPTCPNFYGEPGPLMADSPVVKVVGAPPESDYGRYHGVLPYPESTFAPFSSVAGGGPTNLGTTSPAPADAPAPPRP